MSDWYKGFLVDVTFEPYGPYDRGFFVHVEQIGPVDGILKAEQRDEGLKVGDSVEVKLYITAATVLISDIRKAKR